MQHKFSQKERLEIYYTVLDRLENQLTSELAVELVSKKRTMKPSKTTRYKISIIKRTISSMESLINANADRYYNWSVTRDDIQRELDGLQEIRNNLELQVTDYKNQVENGQGLNFNSITSIAMKFTAANQELVATKKNIDTLIKEAIKHEKKKPPYASYISRERLLAEMAGDTRHILPEALTPIARQALGSIDEGDFIFKSTESTDSAPIVFPAESLYPDVSFMFEGREKDESEIEGSIREDSTVASDKDAPDS